MTTRPRARNHAPRRQPRRRPSRLRRSWDKYWYAWAMVAPVVVIFLVLIFYPLVRGVFLSFTNLTEANQLTERCTKSITGGETCVPNPDRWSFVGIDNYVNVLSWRGRRVLAVVHRHGDLDRGVRGLPLRPRAGPGRCC